MKKKAGLTLFLGCPTVGPLVESEPFPEISLLASCFRFLLDLAERVLDSISTVRVWERTFEKEMRKFKMVKKGKKGVSSARVVLKNKWVSVELGLM